LDFEERRITII